MKTAEIDTGALIDGRYRVIRPLGAGGMAHVVLAHDEQLGREVAVKVFPPVVADRSDDGRRRRDEVTLLAGLSHPGLVVLFDAALEAKPAYLTMEHVEGETLAQRLRRRPMPPTEAAALVIAIADALAFVHMRGIVHRDVKPGNILLPESKTGTGAPAKLADFGIARLIDDSRLTATGSVMGTAAYISPEQASGLPASPASDIYALGIVFIECLTAVHPFPGTALESASARLTKQPELGDARLAAERSLLGRMTALDPVDRPSAAEVVAELTGAATTRVMTPYDALTEPMSPAAATTTRLATAPPGARRTVAVAVAVLVAIALVVATVVVSISVLPALAWLRPGADPAVTYPAVAGDLGIHLGQLQDAVEGTDLEDPALAATVAAADGDYDGASSRLDAIGILAAEALSSGELDAARAERIDAAIADAQSDLAELLTPPDEAPSDSPGNNGNGNGNGNRGKKDG